MFNIRLAMKSIRIPKTKNTDKDYLNKELEKPLKFRLSQARLGVFSYSNRFNTKKPQH